MLLSLFIYHPMVITKMLIEGFALKIALELISNSSLYLFNGEYILKSKIRNGSCHVLILALPLKECITGWRWMSEMYWTVLFPSFTSYFCCIDNWKCVSSLLLASVKYELDTLAFVWYVPEWHACWHFSMQKFLYLILFPPFNYMKKMRKVLFFVEHPMSDCISSFKEKEWI